jgi:hypothetical protein
VGILTTYIHGLVRADEICTPDLEIDCHQTKRRFTDYCFQRVKVESDGPTLFEQLPTTNIRAAGSRASSGKPVVRATSPGAEIRDEAERRSAQKALRDRYVPAADAAKRNVSSLTDRQKATTEDGFTQSTRPIAPLRQFHLYHGHKHSHSNHLSGIQKRKTTRRNYLATFVERSKPSTQVSELPGTVNEDSTRKNHGGGNAVEQSVNPSMSRTEKTGQSMHDHPSTWDYDSDQLAEELAAFALEISHNEKQDEQSSRSSETTHVGLKNANMIPDEDFIYDMFIRVPIGHGKSEEQALSDLGVLVIDDEYQELWQTFAESDSDSEWDEEDPDSNGLC